MVKSCSVLKCTGKWTKDCKLSFHSFPKNNETLKKWLAAIGRVNFKPSVHCKVCSKHFPPDSYNTSPWSSLKSLKPDAVPSIFDFQTHPHLANNGANPPAEEALEFDNKLSLQSMEKSKKTTATYVNLSDHNPTGEIVSINHQNAVSQRPMLPTGAYPSLVCEDTLEPIETLVEEIIESTPKKRKRRKTYVGDIDESGLSEKEQELLNTFKVVLFKKNKVIRSLRQTNRRLTTKISKLESQLKNNNISDENVQTRVVELTSDSFNALLVRMLATKKPRFCSPELKTFALTLSGYSKRAYDYVRETFLNVLPHPRTLQKWCESESSKTDFVGEVVEVLEEEVLL